MTEAFRGRGRPSSIQKRFSPARFPSATPPTIDTTKEVEIEADEVKELRSKYGPVAITQVKELFPDWKDEDILFAIQEAHGDLNLAIFRISEGQANQWSDTVTKAKKSKKDTPTTPLSSSTNVVQSPFAGPGRGGGAIRGRGGFDATRGGRGGSRGGGAGRGGFVGAGRGGAVRTPSSSGAATPTPAATTTNGSSAAGGSTSTPASFITPPPPSAPLPTVPAWGPAKTVAAPVAPVAPTVVESPAPAESSSAATGGWGKKEEEVKPTTNGLGDEIDQIAEVATKEWEEEAELEDKKAVEPVVVVEKKKSAIVKPGSKMSWAQIARPPSPPKPTPPPPAPIAEVSRPALVQLPSTVNSTTLPSSSSSRPSAGWGVSASTPTPLAVGEGWADAVVASSVPVVEEDDKDKILQVEARLPPNDTNAAGGIEVSKQLVEKEESLSLEEEVIVVAEVEVEAEVPAAATTIIIEQQQPVEEPSLPVPETIATVEEPQLVNTSPPSTVPVVVIPQAQPEQQGPPGLLAKRQSGRQMLQSEAVVMPQVAQQPELGVQFGSLSLFEGTGGDNGDAHQQQQQQPQQSFQSYAQEQPVQQQQQHYAQEHQQQQQHQQPQHRHVQEQGVQTLDRNSLPLNYAPQQPSQHQQQQQVNYGAPQQQQSQAQQPSHQSFGGHQSAFANRYSGYPLQHLQQQQQPQAQEDQQQLSSQQVPTSQSPYAPFKPEAYFQAAQGHGHSPAPLPIQQQTGYPTFSPLPQQGHSQHQQQQSQHSQSDYSSFYDQYGQVAPGSQFQTPSPLPRQDDPSASSTPISGVITPQQLPGQQQQQQHQQQQQQIPQQGQYGMLPNPYYSPYGYYPSYNQNYPQNYSVQSQYQQTQQPYGAYGQYPAARGLPAQYTQASQQQQASQQHSLGGFRQQQPQQQQQPVTAGAYQQQYSGAGAYAAQTQQEGRKDYGSSKDLDRPFFT